MVWSYQAGNSTEDGHWKQIPTEYKVGTRAELLFWRVMNAATGATLKEFFYSPRDYEMFSGRSIYEFKEQFDAWTEQHKAALAEFEMITENQGNSNATVVVNGRAYTSFFPTEQPI